MGSLMAGWDSPTLDSDTVSSMRNRSLTKEEIEYFRRLQKTSEEEEHPLDVICSLKNMESKDTGTVHQSTYSPMLEICKKHPETGGGLGINEAKKTDDWWTRSSWAFLNEPPYEDVDKSSFKYESQFHVAEAANKKLMHAN
ncbi:hypothetical protein CKAN_02412900 [Cinnamomum micranthum f. kanehirae]|uniref:Uncharacterized protein n=1 Tax=Cinnamomum micranthum f. kanehirae TaxID=337451 RepID=A0A3S3N2R1_9MAGN|nr:hypothetical protein CKAN_02412900 [Cinnamomum micranthum f. kanehirae]